MNDQCVSDSWEIPTWHQDFGDPAIEIEMLRDFCNEAFNVIPNLTTMLCTPEEGYLYVKVLSNNEKISELYVVSGKEGKRFALYGFQGETETGEHYFTEYGKGIQCLKGMVGL